MKHLYFEWLYQLVCWNRRSVSYKKLFRYLFDTEFTYILQMDENRAIDGIDLRYRFCYENSYEYSDLESELNAKPCSVLEMMIALALRFEEHILVDPDEDNRTPDWFWMMMSSLGISEQSDYIFNEHEVAMIIERFLKREYDPDGNGSLFYMPGCPRDLRHVQIWYQACWFFDSIL